MKRVIVLALVLTMGFLLAGCGKNKSASTNENKQAQNQETEGENNKAGQKMGDLMKQGEYVGKQIAQALQNNERLKCTYRVAGDEGEMLTEVYMQGDKYRSTMNANGEEMTSLFDGNVHYTWNNSTKKGFKMDSKCLEELQAPDEPETVEDMDVDLDSYKTTDELLEQETQMSCEKTGQFETTPPSDVEFVDQCEMLKQQMQMLEKMQNSIPEEYMQQMQQMQNVPNVQ